MESRKEEKKISWPNVVSFKKEPKEIELCWDFEKPLNYDLDPNLLKSDLFPGGTQNQLLPKVIIYGLETSLETENLHDLTNRFVQSSEECYDRKVTSEIFLNFKPYDFYTFKTYKKYGSYQVSKFFSYLKDILTQNTTTSFIILIPFFIDNDSKFGKILKDLEKKSNFILLFFSKSSPTVTFFDKKNERRTFNLENNEKYQLTPFFEFLYFYYSFKFQSFEIFKELIDYHLKDDTQPVINIDKEVYKLKDTYQKILMKHEEERTKRREEELKKEKLKQEKIEEENRKKREEEEKKIQERLERTTKFNIPIDEILILINTMRLGYIVENPSKIDEYSCEIVFKTKDGMKEFLERYSERYIPKNENTGILNKIGGFINYLWSLSSQTDYFFDLCNNPNALSEDTSYLACKSIKKMYTNGVFKFEYSIENFLDYNYYYYDQEKWRIYILIYLLEFQEYQEKIHKTLEKIFSKAYFPKSDNSKWKTLIKNLMTDKVSLIHIRTPPSTRWCFVLLEMLCRGEKEGLSLFLNQINYEEFPVLEFPSYFIRNLDYIWSKNQKFLIEMILSQKKSENEIQSILNEIHPKLRNYYIDYFSNLDFKSLNLYLKFLTHEVIFDIIIQNEKLLVKDIIYLFGGLKLEWTEKNVQKILIKIKKLNMNVQDLIDSYHDLGFSFLGQISSKVDEKKYKEDLKKGMTGRNFGMNVSFLEKLVIQERKLFESGVSKYPEVYLYLIDTIFENDNNISTEDSSKQLKLLKTLYLEKESSISFMNYLKLIIKKINFNNFTDNFDMKNLAYILEILTIYDKIGSEYNECNNRMDIFDEFEKNSKNLLTNLKKRFEIDDLKELYLKEMISNFEDLKRFILLSKETWDISLQDLQSKVDNIQHLIEKNKKYYVILQWIKSQYTINYSFTKTPSFFLDKLTLKNLREALDNFIKDLRFEITEEKDLGLIHQLIESKCSLFTIVFRMNNQTFVPESFLDGSRKTIQILESLFQDNGSMTLDDLQIICTHIIEFIQKERLNLKDEIKKFTSATGAIENNVSKESIEKVFELVSYKTNLNNIKEVSNQFNIKIEGLDELMEKIFRSKITQKDIDQILKDLKTCLCDIEGFQAKIFQTLMDSKNLVNNIRHYKENDFMNRVEIIKNNEGAQSAIILDLIMVYKLLSPLFKDLTFSEYSKFLKEICFSEERTNTIIIALNNCIHKSSYIYYLLNETSGISVESTSFNIKQVLENGKFIFNTNLDDHKMELYLNYTYSRGGSDSQSITLNHDKIIDLLRKSVFCKNSKVEKKDLQIFEDFEEIYKNIKLLLEKRMDLKSSGHPLYQSKSGGLSKANIHVLENHLNSYKQDLAQWEKEIIETIEKCPEILKMERNQAIKMINELSKSIQNKKISEILFTLITITFVDSLKSIEISTFKSLLDDLISKFNSNQNSFKLLEEFISLVKTKVEIQRFEFDEDDQKPSYYIDSSTVGLATVTKWIFYKVKTMGNIIYPYQVFWCTKKTSLAEYRWFIERRKKYPSQLYFVLGMDDVSLNLSTEIINQENTKSFNTFFIFNDRYKASTMSILERYDIEKDISERGFETSMNIFKSEISKRKFFNVKNEKKLFEDIKLIRGDALQGKTHYIQKNTKGAYINIGVNEDFQSLHIIEELLKNQDGIVSLHFNVQYNNSLNANEPLKLLDMSFFNFLLFGIWSDQNTGDVLIPKNENTYIFFEIPDVKTNFTKNLESSIENIKLVGNEFKVENRESFEMNPILEMVLTFYHMYINDSFTPKCVLEWDQYFIDNKNSILKLKESIFKDIKIKYHQGQFVTLMEAYCKYIVHKFKDMINTTAIFEERNFDSVYQEQERFLKKNIERNVMTYFDEKCLNGEKEYVVINDRPHIKGLSHFKIFYEQVLDLCNTEVDIYSKKGKKIHTFFKDHPYLKFQMDSSPTLLIPHKDDNLSADRCRGCIGLLANKGGQTSFVDGFLNSKRYVLTPDITLKMLILDEKRLSGLNAIISGGTGVGKTELLNVYAELLNFNVDLKGIESVCEHFFNQWLNKPSIEISEEQVGKYKKNMMKFKKSFNFDEVKEIIEDIFKEKTTNEDLKIKMINNLAKDFIDFISKHEKFHIYLQILDLTSTTQNLIIGIINQSEKIPTVLKLIDLFKEIEQAKTRGIFYTILMHPGLSISKIREEFIKISKEHHIMSQKIKDLGIKHDFKTIVFIDELNTSSCLGFLKEVLIDRTMDGKSDYFPNSIFFVSAVNLAQKDEKGKDTYNVHEIPKSMEQILIDFSEMDEDQQDKFIRYLFNSDFCPDFLKNSDSSAIQNLMLFSHQFIKNNVTPQEGRIRVSIRDVMRFIDIFKFFSNNEFLKYSSDSSYVKHWIETLIVFAMCYYLRLSHNHRKDFIKKFKDNLLKEKVFSTSEFNKLSRDDQSLLKKIFETDLNEILAQQLVVFYQILIDKKMIPEGIAQTTALMENLFCNFVCIQSKIPLMITGPPGTSKTLSYQIASRLKSVYKWSKVVNGTNYQCTEFSTPDDIENVYKQRLDMLFNLKQRNEDVKEVVSAFFDEGGLPDELKHVMKVIHYYLDHPQISTVIISNKILDAAKTNRCLHLQQGEPTREDLIILAKGILSQCQCENYLIEAIVDSYQSLNKIVSEIDKNLRKEADFFQQRDYIFFLRLLAKCQTLNPETLYYSLQRNFNGVSNKCFQQIIELFFKNIQKQNHLFLIPKNTLSHLELLKQAIERSHESHIHSDPNTAPFRFIQLIDPSDAESSIQLLFEMKILDRQKVEIISISEFPEDDNLFGKSQETSKVKLAMEVGKTLILVNSSSINTNFYDLFNRHFTEVPRQVEETDEQGNKKLVTRNQYFANIAVGSLSSQYQVHEEFQIIVHTPLSTISSTPAPFLNRFEKYQFGYENILNENMNKSSDYKSYSKKKAYEYLKTGIQKFLDFLTQDSYLGIKKDETISSYLEKHFHETDQVFYYPFSMIERNFKFIDYSDQKLVEILRLSNYHFLQVIRPESLYLQRGTLPKPYLIEYLHNQEHFSFVRFFKNLLINHLSNPKEITKYLIYLRVGGKVNQLEKNKELQKELFGDHSNYMITSFSEMNSRNICDGLVDKMIKNDVEVLICISDLKRDKTNQINYLKFQLDTKYLDAGKKPPLICFILLLPPNLCDLNTVSDVIHLNHWKYLYIDSYDYRGSNEKNFLNPSWWFSYSMHIEHHYSNIQKEIDPLIDRIVNDMEFSTLKGKFTANKAIREIVVEKFETFWLGKVLSFILEKACKDIVSGISTDSLMDLIYNGLESLLSGILLHYFSICKSSPKCLESLTENDNLSRKLLIKNFNYSHIEILNLRGNLPKMQSFNKKFNIPFVKDFIFYLIKEWEESKDKQPNQLDYFRSNLYFKDEISEIESNNELLIKFEKDFYELLFGFNEDENMLEFYKSYYMKCFNSLSIIGLVDFHSKYSHDVSYLKTFIQEFSYFEK